MDLQERAESWRVALRADGWESSPIYNQYARDHGDRSFEYHRDGWTIHIYDQPAHFKTERQISIAAWGPDRLAVELPEVYNFEQMERNLLLCCYCKKYVSETVSIGFAGRCCPECRKLHAHEVEYRGWTN